MGVKCVIHCDGITTPGFATGLSIPSGGISLGEIGYSGQPHSFGFTESFWRDSDSIPAARTFVKNTFGPARAGVLPSQGYVRSATLYAAGSGRGIEVPLGYQGTAPSTDQVNVALLMATRHGSAPVQRRWWLHSIPDDWVIGGELQAPLAVSQRIRTYFDAINTCWWLGLVRNNETEIANVTDQGVVTLKVNQPYAVGQFVTVSRTLKTNGKRAGGKFMVSAVGPLLSQFTLALWDKGATTGGRAFVPSYIFYLIGAGDGAFVERAGTRRVGRPGKQYRGRQSARPRA
jgi:hypothetical protein